MLACVSQCARAFTKVSVFACVREGKCLLVCECVGLYESECVHESNRTRACMSQCARVCPLKQASAGVDGVACLFDEQSKQIDKKQYIQQFHNVVSILAS